MREFRRYYAVGALLLGAMAMQLGCSQYAARTFGGSSEVQLPEGAQLLNMTWKGADLWVLYYDTRTSNCIFQEYSEMCLVEGKVLIRNCNPQQLTERSPGAATLAPATKASSAAKAALD